MTERSATTGAGTPRRSARISAQPPIAQQFSEGKVKGNKIEWKKRKIDDESTTKDDSPSKKMKSAVGEPESAEGRVQHKVDIGDSLPSLMLKNEKDEDVDIASLASEKGVVLFLVPKADTPGCTNQACGFRDIYPDFTLLNFDVYCLSADTPESQTKWQTKTSLPYPLLSDRKRLLINALGAESGGKTKRSHFIFEKGGKLVEKKIPVKPVDSPKLAIEFVRSLTQS